MLSVSYVGKNAYSASKTSGVLRAGALEADRGYVVCWPTVGYPLLVKDQYISVFSLLKVSLTRSSSNVPPEVFLFFVCLF